MSRQFDVCQVKGGALVLVMSHDLLNWLTMRQVAPLIPLEKAGEPTRGLNPVVEVDGRLFLLKPELMAAIPVSQLSKSLENLSHRRGDFIRGLDLLFTGV